MVQKTFQSHNNFHVYPNRDTENPLHGIVCGEGFYDFTDYVIVLLEMLTLRAACKFCSQIVVRRC